MNKEARETIKDLREEIKGLQYAIGILLTKGYSTSNPALRELSDEIIRNIKEIENIENEN